MIINQSDNRKKYIFKGLGTLFLYFFITLFKNMPFYLIHINVSDIPKITYNIYSLVIEITLILLIYFIFEEEIKKAIEDIKINHYTYFTKYFKIYLIGIIIMMASNMIINALGGGISQNEEAIRGEFNSFPVYTYIASVFLAPLLEELIFRLSLKALIKNKYIYIFISGFIFGSLHLIGMPINKLFPLYLISYCSAGWAFAYIMSKTNNILVSSGFHFMHNGIIMSIQTFLLIFT